MNEPLQRVTLVDLDVPFGRLVAFFVKASLAAIPAAIIVWVILWVIAAAVWGLLGLSFFRPFQV
jgi:fatty acid desaturase